MSESVVEDCIFSSVLATWPGEIVGVWVFSTVPTPVCIYELDCFHTISGEGDHFVAKSMVWF